MLGAVQELGRWCGAALALAASVAGVVGERSGLFLYTGYVPLQVLAGMSAVALISRTFGFAAFGMRGRLLGGLLGAGLVAGSWAVKSAGTTERKVFYLKACEVVPGMELPAVELVMHGYHSWAPERGHVSYQFLEGDVMDVLAVDYDARTRRVSASNLILD